MTVTPKKPSKKRSQILTTAGELFLAEGFQGLSMDKLAAAVPVSKPTLYTHFTDKNTLFAAVISAKCQEVMEGLSADIAREDSTPTATLTRFGTHFTTRIYRAESLQFHRMMVAEAERIPEMTQLFYESGPAKIHQILVQYLQTLHQQGHYHIAHPALSADMFFGIIKGARHMRCILGLAKPPSATERQTMVAHAVSIFLHGHIKQPPQRKPKN